MKEMTKITRCDAMNCAYNKDGMCHTPAITVGSSEAMCDTFLTAMRKGGMDDTIGGVGACKMDNCRFNESLECSAPGISVNVHADHADCMTFKAR